jgi:acetyltransferase-like isoleucine patch superfamily enzyme
MTAVTPTPAKDRIKAFLLGHGLDLDGSINGSLIWESPVKIFHSAHVHDVEIGAYSYISPRTEIRHAMIGRYCSIGDNVNMRGSAHPKEWLSSHPFAYQNIYPQACSYTPPLTFGPYGRKTLIGHDVWIGSQAIILPGIAIGTGAIVGAGAVVSKDVPAYAVVVGNPARVVKYRFGPDLIERLLQSEWWTYNLPRYLERQPALPLNDPNRMLDFLARNGGSIDRIDLDRKSYRRQKDRIVIQKAPPAGT